MKVGITGSRDLTGLQRQAARRLLRDIFEEEGYGPGDELHYGDAEGIDKIAVAVGNEFGMKPVPHRPIHFRWEGSGGIKWRNKVLVFSVQVLYALHSPQSQTGGTVWTYDFAQRHNKPAEWFELPEDSDEREVSGHRRNVSRACTQ